MLARLSDLKAGIRELLFPLWSKVWLQPGMVSWKGRPKICSNRVCKKSSPHQCSYSKWHTYDCERPTNKAIELTSKQVSAKKSRRSACRTASRNLLSGMRCILRALLLP